MAALEAKHAFTVNQIPEDRSYQVDDTNLLRVELSQSSTSNEPPGIDIQSNFAQSITNSQASISTESEIVSQTVFLPTYHDDILAEQANEKRLNTSGKVHQELFPNLQELDKPTPIRPLQHPGAAFPLVKGQPEIVFGGDKAGRGVVWAGKDDDKSFRQKEGERIVQEKLARAEIEYKEIEHNPDVDFDTKAHYRRLIANYSTDLNRARHGIFSQDIQEEVSQNLERQIESLERQYEANLLSGLQEKRRERWNDEYVLDSEGGSMRVSKARFQELRDQGKIGSDGRIIVPDNLEGETSGSSSSRETQKPSKKKRRGLLGRILLGEDEPETTATTPPQNETIGTSEPDTASGQKQLSDEQQAWLRSLQSRLKDEAVIREIEYRGEDPKDYGY